MEKSTQEFQLYKAHSDSYICSLIPGMPNFQAQYTPGVLEKIVIIIFFMTFVSLTESAAHIVVLSGFVMLNLILAVSKSTTLVDRGTSL